MLVKKACLERKLQWFDLQKEKQKRLIELSTEIY